MQVQYRNSHQDEARRQATTFMAGLGPPAAGRKQTNVPALAKGKSTYHVFLPPSSLAGSEKRHTGRRKTKLIKVSAAPTAEKRASAHETRPAAQKENVAPGAASPRLDKGKGRQTAHVDDTGESSTSRFFPRPPPPRSNAVDGYFAISRRDDETSGSAASFGRQQPTPTPAEAAAARRAARLHATNADNAAIATSDDNSSLGVGRGVPPGQEFESRLDQPTSWTDTFLAGLDEHEADLTARDVLPSLTRTTQEDASPFSPGTIATGRALCCSHPAEEGIETTEPSGEAYASGTQADRSIDRALRSESESRRVEAPTRHDARHDDSVSVWPVPSAMSASASASGRKPTNNRVRFVSAKQVMASAGSSGRAERGGGVVARQPPQLDVIPSAEARADSETEDEEEFMLTPPDSRVRRTEPLMRRDSTDFRSVATRPTSPTRPASRSGHPARVAPTSSKHRDINTAPPHRQAIVTRPVVCHFSFGIKSANATTEAVESIGSQSAATFCVNCGTRGLKRIRSDARDETTQSTVSKRARGVSRSHSDVAATSSPTTISHRDVSLDRRGIASSKRAQPAVESDRPTSLVRAPRESAPTTREHGESNESVALPRSSPADRSNATDRVQHSFQHRSSSTVTGPTQSREGSRSYRTTSDAAPIASPPSRLSEAPPPQKPRRPPLVPSRLAQSFTADSLEDSTGSSTSVDGADRRSEASGSSSINTTGMESIPPPPTLHFDPHRVTPIASILQHPHALLSARNGGPTEQSSAKRINLLALVREVAPLEEVGTKVYKHGRVVEGAVNMTYRSSLLLMDGCGSLLKVSIWGECAQQWTGDAPDDDDGDDDDTDAGTQSQSQEPSGLVDIATQDVTTFSALMRPNAMDRRGRARKVCPSLRPGDVISLESIIISLRPSSSGGDASTSRIPFRRGGPPAQMEVQGSASTRTNSRAELCWRWNTVNARERRKYTFDPVLSTFDRRCKAVWRCAQRWNRRGADEQV